MVKKPQSKKNNFSIVLHQMLDGKWTCHCMELNVTTEGRDTPMEALRSLGYEIDRYRKWKAA